MESAAGRAAKKGLRAGRGSSRAMLARRAGRGAPGVVGFAAEAPGCRRGGAARLRPARSSRPRPGRGASAAPGARVSIADRRTARCRAASRSGRPAGSSAGNGAANSGACRSTPLRRAGKGSGIGQARVAKRGPGQQRGHRGSLAVGVRLELRVHLVGDTDGHGLLSRARKPTSTCFALPGRAGALAPAPGVAGRTGRPQRAERIMPRTALPCRPGRDRSQDGPAASGDSDARPVTEPAPSNASATEPFTKLVG